MSDESPRVKQLVPIPEGLTALLYNPEDDEYIDAITYGWSVFYAVLDDGRVVTCAIPSRGNEPIFEPALRFVPTKDARKYFTCADRVKLSAPKMYEILNGIEMVMRETDGIAGWHYNGEIASWGELSCFSQIPALLKYIKGEEESKA